MLHSMKKTLISEELIDTLEKAFPQITIEPGTNPDNIMYNAGERHVIEWLKRHKQDTTIGSFDNRSAASA